MGIAQDRPVYRQLLIIRERARGRKRFRQENNHQPRITRMTRIETQLLRFGSIRVISEIRGWSDKSGETTGRLSG